MRMLGSVSLLFVLSFGCTDSVEGVDGGTDGAAPMDGATTLDGGTGADGSTEMDGSTGTDGGTDVDGGANADGGPGTDAGPDTRCAMEGATRCADATVETCVASEWTPTESCAASCGAGACSDDPVRCTPDATRCYRSSVQRCNREGTAWAFDAVCAESCADGLCSDACVDTETRCVGDELQACDGGSFGALETCGRGCARAGRGSVCVEEGLRNDGIVTTLSGPHVYEGCVEINLGGTLEVPAGETLEIWARCFTLSTSSDVAIGAGSRFIMHAREDIVLDGTVAGGDESTLEALQTLRLAGSVSSARSILRSDDLEIQAGGTTAGTSLNAALYGQRFVNDGAHSGIVSVMPPASVESSSHPSGQTWNLAGDQVVIAWERPFPSVVGYYVLVGDEVPSPANAELRTEEFIVLDASTLNPGSNRVRIVSVNADSEIGTFPQDLVIELNVRAPIVSSTSHPLPSVWGGPDDVFLSWSDPSGVPAAMFAGYVYRFDRFADSVPDPASDTFDDRRMLLLPDQAPGLWYFHIVNLDHFGRPSPVVSHYPVRVGPEPGYGNVAGTVRDGDGDPIEGARVVLNGGVLRTRTGATGDYTFRGVIPASTEPYTVSASLPGYTSAAQTVTVAASASEIVDFTLVAGGAPGVGFEVSWPFPVSADEPNNPAVAMGPAGHFIWSQGSGNSGSGGTPDTISIHRSTGEQVMRTNGITEYYTWGAPTAVGWDGSRFFAIDFYACDDNGSLLPGHGWSCLQMKSWSPDGTLVAGWTRWRNSGHTGSPSAVWNGSTYGTFFASYTSIYHRELDESLEFVDGREPYQNDLVAGPYGDTRQSARTATVWAGDHYAVIFAIQHPSTGRQTAYFGRWDQDLSSWHTPSELDEIHSSTDVDLAFDGTDTHFAYLRRRDSGTGYDLVLRTYGDETTVVVDSVPIGDAYEPSLAFDGRHLLLAYHDRLEVRATTDHALLESYDLHGVRARVDYSVEEDEGVVLYTLPGEGLVVRSVFAR